MLALRHFGRRALSAFVIATHLTRLCKALLALPPGSSWQPILRREIRRLALSLPCRDHDLLQAAVTALNVCGRNGVRDVCTLLLDMLASPTYLPIDCACQVQDEDFLIFALTQGQEFMVGMPHNLNWCVILNGLFGMYKHSGQTLDTETAHSVIYRSMEAPELLVDFSPSTRPSVPAASDAGACPICLDAMEEGDPVYPIGCGVGHYMHEECANGWRMNHTALGAQKCPMCRKPD